ncbi:MAG: hypothetical protein ACE5EY_03015 [Anaerolineae bacterium]
MTAYQDFTARFKLLIGKHPELITMTLGNIFTMRLIGNKTHGDLAEIAISEFINQYMYDFRSVHVGKDLFRAKSHEQDIEITNEISQESIPVSLKAYGNGPLQLSTDKDFTMFPYLESLRMPVTDSQQISDIFQNTVFSAFNDVNVMPLIYDEASKRCNILIFDYERAKNGTAIIEKITGGRRKHPVYRFFDEDNQYICEVRYGGPDANALQRGLWTHTKNASAYFDSLTNGWVDYSHNLVLVELFSHALISSSQGHEKALEKIKEDIIRIKRGHRIP